MSRGKRTAGTISLLAIVGLSGCASSPEPVSAQAADDPYRAAIEAATAPATPEQIAQAERSDPLTRASFWREEFRKQPADLETTVRFMAALRGIGSYDRAMEIATQTYPIHPGDHKILLELGRTLMAKENYRDAARAFVRSADFAPADNAAPLAALGVAFDRLGEHEKAQEAYREALLRQPDRISTLSNLGLSMALSGDAEGGEIELRKAAALPGADSRVRQNLALILGLQGRFEEMLEVDPSAPRRTVEANQAALKAMMQPARSYEALSEDTAAEAEVIAPAETMVIEETIVQEPEPVETSQTVSPLRPRLRGVQGG